MGWTHPERNENENTHDDDTFTFNFGYKSKPQVPIFLNLKSEITELQSLVGTQISFSCHTCAFSAAMWTGVKALLTLAPAAWSAAMAEACPFCAAIATGVAPLLFGVFTLAPAAWS